MLGGQRKMGESAGKQKTVQNPDTYLMDRKFLFYFF